MNGKSASELIAGYLDVLSAITELTRAMSKITPHGRDYQTETPEVFVEAVRSARRADATVGHHAQGDRGHRFGGARADQGSNFPPRVVAD